MDAVMRQCSGCDELVRAVDDGSPVRCKVCIRAADVQPMSEEKPAAEVPVVAEGPVQVGDRVACTCKLVMCARTLGTVEEIGPNRSYVRVQWDPETSLSFPHAIKRVHAWAGGRLAMKESSLGEGVR